VSTRNRDVGSPLAARSSAPSGPAAEIGAFTIAIITPFRT
jgi:hypothetical protein